MLTPDEFIQMRMIALSVVVELIEANPELNCKLPELQVMANRLTKYRRWTPADESWLTRFLVQHT